MRGRLGTCVVMSALALFPAAASVQPGFATPAAMVRALQVRQDRVVAGEPQALARQARALAELGEELQAMDVRTFADKANLYALLGYLFNGGNPAIVETVLRRLPPELAAQDIVKGALAFAHNRKKVLLHTLAVAETEQADWPEALRLSVYLGTVPDFAEKNPEKASGWLDYVRLAAPGSLFEEAAIRRQIRIAGRLGDTAKIRLLIRSYISRFSASPYAADFWGEFVRVLPSVETRLPDEMLDRLIAPVPERVQYAGYLQVARAALLDGRMDRAFYSAEKAGKLAHDLVVDDSTARLYLAASRAGSPAAPDAAKVLQSIRADNLAVRDRPLLDAAQAVAHGVTEPAGKPENGGDGAAAQEDEAEKTELPVLLDVLRKSRMSVRMQDRGDAIEDFVKKTQGKLEAVDTLLREESE